MLQNQHISFIYLDSQMKLVLDQAVAGDEADSKSGEEAAMKIVEAVVFANRRWLEEPDAFGVVSFWR